jgi:hypothetical protein
MWNQLNKVEPPYLEMFLEVLKYLKISLAWIMKSLTYISEGFYWMPLNTSDPAIQVYKLM